MSSGAEDGDETECRCRDDRQPQRCCNRGSERRAHDEQWCHFPADESRARRHGREYEFQQEHRRIECISCKRSVSQLSGQTVRVRAEGGSEHNDDEAAGGQPPRRTLHPPAEHPSHASDRTDIGRRDDARTESEHDARRQCRWIETERHDRSFGVPIAEQTYDSVTDEGRNDRRCEERPSQSPARVNLGCEDRTGKRGTEHRAEPGCKSNTEQYTPVFVAHPESPIHRVGERGRHLQGSSLPPRRAAEEMGDPRTDNDDRGERGGDSLVNPIELTEHELSAVPPRLRNPPYDQQCERSGYRKTQHEPLPRQADIGDRIENDEKHPSTEAGEQTRQRRERCQRAVTTYNGTHRAPDRSRQPRLLVNRRSVR